jgi:hypothetical protein
LSTAEILIFAVAAHFVGDYLLQTNHMAQEKTSRWTPAILHGITYTIPFLFLTSAPLALFFISATHILIDRFRLVKYVIWFKNQLAPKRHRHPMTPTGYHPDTPDWLAIGLMIVTDNLIHILLNAFALTQLT